MRTRNQERSGSVEPGASQQQSRKRRASSASRDSDAGDSQPASQPALKKTKVVKTHKTITQTLHPQLTPVLEESVRQDSQLDHLSSQLEQPVATLSSASRATTTKTHRRVTISPAAISRISNDTTSTRTRKSLPAQLSGRSNASSHPLNVLVQQRLQLRKERRSLSQVPEAFEDDILITADLEGPSQPSQTYDSIPIDLDDISDKSSAVDSALTVKNEHERLVYEDSIKELANEAAKAKAALEILSVELHSMGFGEPHSDSQTILVSIRKAFDQVRNRLRDVMPVEASDGVLEKTLLVNITDRLLHLDQQNNHKDRMIADKITIERDLLVQVDALVDKLADAEETRITLENEIIEYQAQYESDERFIAELQTRLHQVDTDHSNLRQALELKLTELEETKVEVSTLDDSNQKLGAALEKYRQEERRLQELIERREQEFKDNANEITHKYNRQITSLQEDLDVEQSGREKAEQEAADRSKQLQDLQKSLATETALLNGLRTQIEQMRADYLDVESDKVAAVEEVEHKQSTIDKLQEDVAEAEAIIAELEQKYVKLNTLHESEKRQREAAEAGLDEAQVKIKDLDDKLHKQGVQANELRQKLFEVQQRTQATINELEIKITTIQSQADEALLEETTRRADAESLALERDTQISELEVQLAGVEADMEKALNAKESLLQEIEERSVALDTELEKRTISLKKKTADYNVLKNDTATQIKNLNLTIRTLEEKVAEQEETLIKVRESAALQQEQMNAALQDRDTKIAELQAAQTADGQRLAHLEHEKVSLERRVESEAESMLTYQSEVTELIKSLKDTVVAKQNEINELSRRGVETETAWKNAITNKDRTITELETTVEESSDQLIVLQKRHTDLGELFRAYVEKNAHEMDAMYRELGALKDHAAKRADHLEQEAESILAKLADELADPIVTSVNGNGEAQVVKSAKKKTTTTTRKSTNKRVRDSGIGVSSDFEPSQLA